MHSDKKCSQTHGRKMTIQKEPSDELIEAIKEVEEMEKHPERYKSYKSVEEMFEDLNKWLNIKLNSQKLSNGLIKKYWS